MSSAIKYKFLPVMILMVPLWSGCLREDNSDCFKGFYVCFIPENPKHDYPTLVQAADIYFYKEGGDLEAEFHYGKEELRSGDRAAYVENIPEGKYKMVSVVNNIGPYGTLGTDRLERLESRLVEDVSQKRLPDFFSGIRDIAVTNSSSPEEEIADIFKHNNHLHIEVIFEGYQIPQGFEISNYIEGNNGAYYHQLGTSPEESFRSYLPYRT